MKLASPRTQSTESEATFKLRNCFVCLNVLHQWGIIIKSKKEKGKVKSKKVNGKSEDKSSSGKLLKVVAA